MSRVSPGTILLAFVAVLCGLLGAFVLTRPRPQAVAQAAKKSDKILVPISSTNLQTGREITLGDIALLRLSRAEIKKRGLRSPFMANTQQIIGRVIKTPLKMGSTFRTDDLFPEGLGPGIDELLSPGYRAVTVSVNGDAALLGFAAAGSWVDVIFRSDSETNRTDDARFRNFRNGSAARQAIEDVTLTLLDRVRVLALDKNTVAGVQKQSRAADKATSVTLAVTREQAERLRVVEGHGDLSLVLRRADDIMPAPIESEPKTLSDVLQRRDTIKTMEIYRGTNVERVMYQSNGNDWTAYREPSAKDETELAKDAAKTTTN